MSITAAEFLKNKNSSDNKSKTTTTKSRFVSAKDFASNRPKKEPTFLQKAGEVGKEIVKGIVSPIATTVARPIQLGAELLGASDQQVNDVTKKLTGDWVAPTPQNAGDVKKDVGRAIETAALAIPGSTAVKTIAGGATFGVGSSLEQGNDLVSAETGKQALIGGSLAGILHGAVKGVSKLIKGEPLINKVVSDEAALAAAKERAPYTVPEAGTPAPKLLKEGTNVIELPAPGILEGQAKLREGQPLTTVQEFLNKPKAERVPKVAPTEPQPLRTEFKPSEFQPSAPVANVPEEVVQEGMDILEKAKPGVFSPKTREIYNRKFIEDMKNDPEMVRKIALGFKEHPQGIPQDAYNALLSNEAEKVGNNKLLDELSKKGVPSISGQKLEANKMRTKGGTVDILREIRAELEDKLSPLAKRTQKAEMKKYEEGVRKALFDIGRTKPTKELVLETLNKIICK